MGEKWIENETGEADFNQATDCSGKIDKNLFLPLSLSFSIVNEMDLNLPHLTPFTFTHNASLSQIEASLSDCFGIIVSLVLLTHAHKEEHSDLGSLDFVTSFDSKPITKKDSSASLSPLSLSLAVCVCIQLFVCRGQEVQCIVEVKRQPVSVVEVVQKSKSWLRLKI